MITNFNTYITEGLRDKMIPKNNMDVINKIMKSEDLYDITHFSKDNVMDLGTIEQLEFLSGKLGIPSTDLMILNDSFIHHIEFNSIIEFFKSLIKDKNDYEEHRDRDYFDVKIYKNDKIIFRDKEIVDDRGDYITEEHWIYFDKNITNNITESLRDMMTPKPEEEIRSKIKKKLGIDSDIISVKLWNPYGYKLVSKDSGIEEENYRVNYHRLTGDIMKIYDFMVDYTEGSPGSAEYYITSGLIKD